MLLVIYSRKQKWMVHFLICLWIILTWLQTVISVGKNMACMKATTCSLESPLFWLLKSCKEWINVPLMFIINQSLCQDVFPWLLKVAAHYWKTGCWRRMMCPIIIKSFVCPFWEGGCRTTPGLSRWYICPRPTSSLFLGQLWDGDCVGDVHQ